LIKTLRRLRAALGNGLVWGATWFTTAFVAYGGLGLLGAFEGLANPLWLVFGIAFNVGVTGLITGLAFSAYLRFGFLDRPLLGLRARWMALGAYSGEAVHPIRSKPSSCSGPCRPPLSERW
jgi:hypothetical protein